MYELLCDRDSFFSAYKSQNWDLCSLSTIKRFFSNIKVYKLNS